MGGVCSGEPGCGVIGKQICIHPSGKTGVGLRGRWVGYLRVLMSVCVPVGPSWRGVVLSGADQSRRIARAGVADAACVVVAWSLCWGGIILGMYILLLAAVLGENSCCEVAFPVRGYMHAYLGIDWNWVECCCVGFCLSAVSREFVGECRGLWCLFVRVCSEPNLC